MNPPPHDSVAANAIPALGVIVRASVAANAAASTFLPNARARFVLVIAMLPFPVGCINIRLFSAGEGRVRTTRTNDQI